MNNNWRNLLLVASLGLGAGTMTSGCVVRAQVRPMHVVTKRPPAPRYVTPQTRPGQVWVKGRWQWQNNNWAWTAGSYVPARPGRSYVAGRWEQRGNRWHWIDGRWEAGAGGRAVVRDNRGVAPPPRVVAPPPRVVPPPRGVDVRDHRRPAVRAFPIAAPPAPRYQRPARQRAGSVWIQGRYQWQNGAYVWNVGRWEKARAQQVWVAGSWTSVNGRFTWTAGYWQAAPSGVNVRDHHNNGRKNEVVPARRGRPR